MNAKVACLQHYDVPPEDAFVTPRCWLPRGRADRRFDAGRAHQSRRSAATNGHKRSSGRILLRRAPPKPAARSRRPERRIPRNARWPRTLWTARRRRRPASCQAVAKWRSPVRAPSSHSRRTPTTVRSPRAGTGRGSRFPAHSIPPVSGLRVLREMATFLTRWRTVITTGNHRSRIANARRRLARTYLILQELTR